MVHKIESKIVGYKVVDKTQEIIREELNEIKPTEKLVGIVTEAMLGQKIQRNEVISGTTYRIKPGNSSDSYFITINSQEINGRQHPMEIFINSKNVEHFQWVSTVTRLISAVFRKGGDYQFIIDDLQAIHDPLGGYWGTRPDKKTGKKKFYKSILNEIADIIAEYLEGLNPEERPAPTAMKEAKTCPECGTKSLVLMDGCATCLDCGYSKCG